MAGSGHVPPHAEHAQVASGRAVGSGHASQPRAPVPTFGDGGATLGAAGPDDPFGHHAGTPRRPPELGGLTAAIKREGRQALKSTVLLGAHLPFFYFVLLLSLFTYSYHSSPVLAWFAAVLSTDLSIVGAWPQVTTRPGGRDRWDWLPMVLSLFAVGCGVFLGIFSNHMMEPWLHARFLDHYDEVLPSSNPSAVFDAGVIRFAEGTRLDVYSSVGYKVWPHTYCAAPIVGDSSDAPVGFWAVGMNCCGSRGDFWCDDAESADAHSGLRIESHALGKSAGHSTRDNFEKAVKMAGAVYNLEIPETQILVQWYKHPQSVAYKSWWFASLFFVVMLLISVCWCLGMQHVLIQMKRLQA